MSNVNKQQAVPDGYALVRQADLRKLKASINGECYMGQAWEAETISGMLAAAPQATAEDSSVVQSDAPAPATEYSWSNNGEEYHGRFSSVAEAVCDYLDSYGDDAEDAVRIGEQAYGDAGEAVGDWPELPPEKREQLVEVAPYRDEAQKGGA